MARWRRLRAPRELQWRRRLGFAREGGGCGDLGSIGFQGVRAPYIGRGRGPWRARQGAAQNSGGGRTLRSPWRTREEEEGRPDGRAPPVGGRVEKESEVSSWAGERETGWASGRVLGHRKEKEKEGEGERDGLAGLNTRRGKRIGFAFLKLIQTIEFKLKFREFKFEPNNKQ